MLHVYYFWPLVLPIKKCNDKENSFSVRIHFTKRLIERDLINLVSELILGIFVRIYFCCGKNHLPIPIEYEMLIILI